MTKKVDPNGWVIDEFDWPCPHCGYSECSLVRCKESKAKELFMKWFKTKREARKYCEDNKIEIIDE